MYGFKPTSETVAYVSETCLVVIYFLYVTQLRLKTRDTYLFLGLLIVFLSYSVTNIFYTAITPESQLLELSNTVSVDILNLYFLWFAFQFPKNYYRKETIIAVAIAAALYIYFLFASFSFVASFAYLVLNVFLNLYASFIFLRKIRLVKNQSLLTLQSNIQQVSQPGIKEIKAYRAFGICCFFNFINWVTLILSVTGIMSLFWWRFLLHVSSLIIFTIFAFTYLNYSRQTNSFQAKLIGLILCVVLVTFGVLPFSIFRENGFVQGNSGGLNSPDSAAIFSQNSLDGFLILIPVLTLILVIVLPIIFKYNILRPLNEIMKGVQRVNAGDLSADVKVEANDEIGTLSKNFNLMTESLRTYSGQMNALVTERTAELNHSLEELKSTQSQLIQSEKMASLGELTAGIAHEIQNPLNFVNNFSDINAELIDELTNELKEGKKDEAFLIAKDIKENEQKINHHGKRADAIVKGMLQHSRTTSGQKEPTDINALADEYLRLSYHGLRAKDKSFNADFKTSFDENVRKLDVVPQDIGRVFLNLFNNAFYAVAQKKKQQVDGYEPMVFVSTKAFKYATGARTGDPVRLGVLIMVKDNGNGMPQSLINKIFQPFFTTKPTGQGTGLGLSISYDIVKAHNGEIKVNTKEGGGSEFVIELPVV